VQCRERYCNILDPSLKTEKWTLEEDKLLLDLAKQHGNKWAKIANLVFLLIYNEFRLKTAQTTNVGEDGKN
jgi:hypothetical protein